MAAPFPLPPPIAPMLAKSAAALPSGPGLLYEPKWDGFRAMVFRSADDLHIQSRELKPLDRYFPELRAALMAALPQPCVVDGEIVIAGADGLDFDALQQRIHPAASRIAALSASIPASFVAFDLLADGDDDLRTRPLAERRARLVQRLDGVAPPVHLTPATEDLATATDWLARFEGAGLDGVMVKRLDAGYEPGARAMVKVKHSRTADCVLAGFRWHTSGPGTLVGSLLLGLYDAHGTLHHIGAASAFTMVRRRELAEELTPLRTGALDDHPWRSWASPGAEGTRMPGAQNRWSAGKDQSWEPLRPERVCEVRYDHMQGDRFRHAAIFVRWRLDRTPASCRYDQLEVTPPYELARVFGGAESGS